MRVQKQYTCWHVHARADMRGCRHTHTSLVLAAQQDPMSLTSWNTCVHTARRRRPAPPKASHPPRSAAPSPSPIPRHPCPGPRRTARAHEVSCRTAPALHSVLSESPCLPSAAAQCAPASRKAALLPQGQAEAVAVAVAVAMAVAVAVAVAVTGCGRCRGCGRGRGRGHGLALGLAAHRPPSPNSAQPLLRADVHQSKVVATASLIVERKFLRGCGKVGRALSQLRAPGMRCVRAAGTCNPKMQCAHAVASAAPQTHARCQHLQCGHVEDVVVDSACRGQKQGQRCARALAALPSTWMKPEAV